jgi:hypothetical protein
MPTPSGTGHGSSAFMTMLGGSLGCFVAVCLVCGGMAFFAFKGCDHVIQNLPTNRGGTGADRPTPDRGTDTFPAAPDQRVTKAKYEALTKGISYADAVAVMGFNGEEMSRVELGGTTTVMYSWQNPDGSNMNATFQKDMLVSKAQFNLR